MTEANITCPSCGTEIPISEALTAKIRAEMEKTLNRESEQKAAKAVQEAVQRTEEALAVDLQDLKNQVAEKDAKIAEARKTELDLRKKARVLEDKEKSIDLEIERKVDAEKATLEETLRKTLSEEQALKLKEKEKTIERLRVALEDAKRKSEQGSMETQGEALELDLQAVLTAQFPTDDVHPVPKGIRGADLIQAVDTRSLPNCGSIIWEAKNTKNWSQQWVAKLKDDQRAVNANVAVLVSVVLPEGIRNFGVVDGVWVSDIYSYIPLAMALRDQLAQVAFARAASAGKSEKMEIIYDYLSGDEFRHRVEAIVETFSDMHEQLARERRAMEKQWKEREKQIQRITLNTVGMYGEMRGIIGSSLPEIPALELEDSKLLEDSKDSAERGL